MLREVLVFKTTRKNLDRDVHFHTPIFSETSVDMALVKLKMHAEPGDKIEFTGRALVPDTSDCKRFL